MQKESESPFFWDNKEEAVKKTKELSSLREEVKDFDNLKKELNDIEEFVKLGELQKDILDKLNSFKKRLEKEEIKIFLNGEYDQGSAILSVYAGAGGQDAEDWATMLLRMYERFCGTRGFKTKVLNVSYGEGGGPQGRIGTKEASLEIEGKYAYGFLKKENGVHRLVRISPFSSQHLRHTSFVLIEVLPVLTSEIKNIEIKEDDLKVDTYRASGPGGQYVNRRESAVRITHLPTKITVTCQSERLQGLNREKALSILKTKIYQMKKLEEEKKLKKIKGDIISASWGNQIRSYVLHPYKLVKDLRTEEETSDVDSVLDGDLDKFIEAEIKS